MNDELKQSVDGLTQELAAQRRLAESEKTKSIAPQPPSVTEAKQAPPPTDSSFRNASKDFHNKVVGPAIAKAMTSSNIGTPTPLSESTIDDTITSGQATTNKLLTGIVKTEKSQLVAQEQAGELSKTEKLVKEKKNSVIIAGLDDKANKQFGGMFSGLKKIFGKKERSTTMPSSPEEDSGGFWSWLGGILLVAGTSIGPMLLAAATGVLTALGTAFMLPVKALSWVGGGIMDIVSGTTRAVTGGFKRLFGMDGKEGIFKKGGKWISKTVGGWWTATSSAIGGVFGKSKPPPAMGAGLTKLAAGASDDVVKTAAKGVGAGRKVMMKGVLKGALRLAGPIAAAGFALYDGASAAMTEYEKSGSILKATKEGVAGALSGITFGLISQESITGAMDAIGDGMSQYYGGLTDAVKEVFTGYKDIGSAIMDGEWSKVGGLAVDTLSKASGHIVDGVKGLWDSATGWLFGSPHATHYINSASDEIHSGTTALASSAGKISSASNGMVTASNNIHSGTTALTSSAGKISSATNGMVTASTITTSDILTSTSNITAAGANMSDSLIKAAGSQNQSAADLQKNLRTLGSPFTGVKQINAKIGDYFSSTSDIISTSSKTASELAADTVNLAESSSPTTSITGIFSKISDYFSSTFNTTTDVISKISSGENPIKAVGTGLVDQVSHFVSLTGGIFTSATAIAVSAGKAFASPIVSLYDTVTGWFTDAEDTVPTKPTPPPIAPTVNNNIKSLQATKLQETSNLAVSRDLQNVTSTLKTREESTGNYQVEQAKQVQADNAEVVNRLTKLCEYQEMQLHQMKLNTRQGKEMNESVTDAISNSGQTTVVSNSNSNSSTINTSTGGGLNDFRSRVNSFA